REPTAKYSAASRDPPTKIVRPRAMLRSVEQVHRCGERHPVQCLMLARFGVALLALTACSQPAGQKTPTPRPTPQTKAGAVTISIVGTNDLHGALERLPL